MKPQAVRIADVVLIGPLMIWGGLRLRDHYPVAGGLLAALGGAEDPRYYSKLKAAGL